MAFVREPRDSSPDTLRRPLLSEDINDTYFGSYSSSGGQIFWRRHIIKHHFVAVSAVLVATLRPRRRITCTLRNVVWNREQISSTRLSWREAVEILFNRKYCRGWVHILFWKNKMYTQPLQEQMHFFYFMQKKNVFHVQYVTSEAVDFSSWGIHRFTHNEFHATVYTIFWTHKKLDTIKYHFTLIALSVRVATFRRQRHVTRTLRNVFVKTIKISSTRLSRRDEDHRSRYWN